MNASYRILALLVASGLFFGSAVAAEPKEKKEKKPIADQFTGTLVTVTGQTSAGLGAPVTIWIDAYTSDEVAASLKTILADKGQAAVRDAMQNHRAGRIRVGENTSYPLAIARQRVATDGRVVMLATNAPLTEYQIQKGMWTQDYPVTFIELKLKADGTGEGTVVGLAKVSIDENKNLVVASLGTQPSRMTDVQTVAKKK